MVRFTIAAVILSFLSLFVPSPAESANKAFDSDTEKLRLALFAQAPLKRACVETSRHPKGESEKYGKDLAQVFTDTISAFRTGDATLLEKHMHPKVAKDNTAIEMILTAANIFGKPMDANVVRVWALNSVEAKGQAPGGLVSCPDEPLSLVPLYGYDLQFVVWIDLMGRQELGRLLAIVVPSKGQWLIGHMHLQRWTTAGMDFNALADSARKDESEGVPLAAWVKWDITSKLLSGSRHFIWQLQSDAVRLRDAVGTPAQFLLELTKRLPEQPIVFAGSVLTDDGSGLLLRMRFPRDTKSAVTRQSCWNAGNALLKDAWFNRLTGVKCSFVSETEPLDRDGTLGGIYFSKSELAKPLPKKS